MTTNWHLELTFALNLRYAHDLSSYNIALQFRSPCQWKTQARLDLAYITWAIGIHFIQKRSSKSIEVQNPYEKKIRGNMPDL